MLDKLICKKREKKSGVETGFPKGTRCLGIIFFLLFLLLVAGEASFVQLYTLKKTHITLYLINVSAAIL